MLVLCGRQIQELVQVEMEEVKAGMDYGHLTMESYTQVWKEYLSQLLSVPWQNWYNRYFTKYYYYIFIVTA